MKLIIQKVTIGIVLVFTYFIAQAQAFNAIYSYDANGNRLTANVIYLQSSLKSAKIPIDQIVKDSSILADSANIPKQGWDKPNIESINGLNIKLYPNPTHGTLLVEISGTYKIQASSAGNKIDVFDMNGRQILHLSPVNTFNTINLSTKPNETYLLKISVMGQVKEYKIIKD
jgi:Secretion system C-terminal sorting domain